MNTRILNRIYILVAAGALFGVLFLRFGVQEHVSYIGIGERLVPVTIADTEVAREKGLSGTSILEAGTGKLFIFDSPGMYGFWMKDMRYPIDIVWIDNDLKVVGITQGVSPDSYPIVFYPPSEVLYVLEVNTGEVAVDNVTVGTQLYLQK